MFDSKFRWLKCTKLQNPACIFYIVTILPMSCLFNDGRKTQRRTGKFLTTHLFLENPPQIKLKKTACSGATEETQTWHRVLTHALPVTKRRESKTENDRIRGTRYYQNQIFLIYWSTKSIQCCHFPFCLPDQPLPTLTPPSSSLSQGSHTTIAIIHPCVMM